MHPLFYLGLYCSKQHLFCVFRQFDRVGILADSLATCSLNMAFSTTGTISLSCDSLVLNALSVAAEFLQRTRQKGKYISCIKHGKVSFFNSGRADDHCKYRG